MHSMQGISTTHRPMLQVDRTSVTNMQGWSHGILCHKIQGVQICHSFVNKTKMPKSVLVSSQSDINMINHVEHTRMKVTHISNSNWSNGVTHIRKNPRFSNQFQSPESNVQALLPIKTPRMSESVTNGSDPTMLSLCFKTYRCPHLS